MTDRSETECAAIKAARKPFAEALTELGLMAPFYHRSAAEIDRLIAAGIDGYRAHLIRVAGDAKKALDDLNDPIPF
ncbi:MAG: DUF6511 domain-containing protein [Rhodospirillaceae bacterium]